MHTQTAGRYAEELLNSLPPALLRRLARAARDLARLVPDPEGPPGTRRARDAALRPYLRPDEIADWSER